MSTKHRKSAMGRSRDFGMNAGKGDKSRITNQTAYAENFEAIDWSSPAKPIPAPNPEADPFESWDR